VLALNDTAVVPAATVTAAGVVSALVLLLTAIAAPPAGAPCVSVTVHVAAAFAPRLPGVQTSVDTCTAAVRFTVVFAVLPL